MSKELDKLLKIANSKSVKDASEIYEIIDDFLRIKVTSLKEEAKEKGVVGTVINYCNFNKEARQYMLLYELLLIMANSKKYSEFDTELDSGYCDKKRYPNFLMFCLACEIRNNKSNTYISLFRSINFNSYLDILDTKKTLAYRIRRNISEIYDRKKMILPGDESTLGEVMDALCKLGSSFWTPGVEEVETYGYYIMKVQETISMLLVKILYNSCYSLCECSVEHTLNKYSNTLINI